MRAELKYIMSPDIDIETYWPDDEQNFGFFIEVMIGPEGHESEEIFGMNVCTPKWLLSNHKSTDVLFGRHMLIVFEYDFDKIRSEISRYCNRCSGENWQEIAEKLSRIGHWEFEDYIPYKG